jgi:hypothetical protein
LDSGRETHVRDHGYIKSVRRGAKLLLHSDGQVAESRAGRDAGGRPGALVVVVVGNIEAQFRLREETKPHECLRTVQGTQRLRAAVEKAILRLNAAGWDDDARVCD